MALDAASPVAAATSWPPPAFRFKPTDEELVVYYLRRKVFGKPSRFDPISVIDIYEFEPWDLPGKSRLKGTEWEWYFFSALHEKPGARSNMATAGGYWKSTGKDRPILYKSQTVGIKKTLVYYRGRAPRGERTDWVMYEYKLADKELEKSGQVQDALVLCRVLQKSGPGPRPKNKEQYGSPFVVEDWDDKLVLVTGEEDMERGAVEDDAYLDGNVLEQAYLARKQATETLHGMQSLFREVRAQKSLGFSNNGGDHLYPQNVRSQSQIKHKIGEWNPMKFKKFSTWSWEELGMDQETKDSISDCESWYSKKTLENLDGRISYSPRLLSKTKDNRDRYDAALLSPLCTDRHIYLSLSQPVAFHDEDGETVQEGEGVKGDLGSLEAKPDEEYGELGLTEATEEEVEKPEADLGMEVEEGEGEGKLGINEELCQEAGEEENQELEVEEVNQEVAAEEYGLINSATEEFKDPEKATLIIEEDEEQEQEKTEESILNEEEQEKAEEVNVAHSTGRYGSKCKDAVKSLGVRVCTLKRKCRQLRIAQWPNNTRKQAIEEQDKKPEADFGMEVEEGKCDGKLGVNEELCQEAGEEENQELEIEEVNQEVVAEENGLSNSSTEEFTDQEKATLKSEEKITEESILKEQEKAEEVMEEQNSPIVSLDSSEQKPSTDFHAPDNIAHLLRALQSDPVVFSSEKKDTGEGLYGECLTKSVLSLGDSTKRNSYPNFDATENKAHLVRSYQSGPVVSLSANENRRETLKRKCITKSILGLEDLQQHCGGRRDDAAKSFGDIYDPEFHATDSLARKSFAVLETQNSPTKTMNVEHPTRRYGSKRKDAAKNLGVRVSTLKPKCRQHRILRWPNNTRKKEKGSVSLPYMME